MEQILSPGWPTPEPTLFDALLPSRGKVVKNKIDAIPGRPNVLSQKVTKKMRETLEKRPCPGMITWGGFS